jgi:hypothetical protein
MTNREQVREAVASKVGVKIVKYMMHKGVIMNMPVELVNELLADIPSLAIVDRSAKLPENPYPLIIDNADGTHSVSRDNSIYAQAQQDMIKAGYVKEVVK